MRLVRQFPAVAFSVVLLSIVGWYVAERSIMMLLVAGVLAAMSWSVTEGPRSRSLPTWVSNILIIAVWLNLVVDFTQHGEDLLGVLGRLIIWLTLIKLYQHKGPRDYVQLLTLSLLLMLLGCVRSADLLYGIVLVLYLAIGLHAVLLLQLYAAHEWVREERATSTPAGASTLLPSPAPIFGRRVTVHFRSLTAGITVAGLVLSGILFVLFPRNLDRTGMGALSSSVQSGFSDEVSLIGGTRITSSRRVVMTVRTEEGPMPGGQPLRLRGAVLDRYDGHGHWSATSHRHWRDVQTGSTDLLPLVTVAIQPRRVLTQHVEVFVPSQTLHAATWPIAIGTDDPLRLRFDTSAQTIRYVGTGGVRRYTVRSDLMADDQTLAALNTQRSIEPVSLRTIQPAVKTIAEGLLRGRLTDGVRDTNDLFAFNRAAARVFQMHLRSKQYTYTTDLHDIVISPDEDPILQFILVTRRGHCEFFASALAALCSSVNIPARIVTGYLSMEYDADAQHYIVRAANAHAWVEVLTGPNRWMTFDPTPHATLLDLHGPKQSVADNMRWLFDRLEASWHNEFLAFDRRDQERLLRRFDPQWIDAARELLRSGGRSLAQVNRAFYLGPAGYIWMGIVAIALVVAAVAVRQRLHRRAQLRAAARIPTGSPETRRWLRQLAFYLDMLVLLKRAGHTKPTWQPPGAFAVELSRNSPKAGALVRSLSNRFYEVRFGARVLSAEEVAETRALLNNLRSTLAR